MSWADTDNSIQRHLCISIALILFTSSVLLLMPGFIQDTSAINPIFSRPNTIVDDGIGPIGSSMPGGPVIASDTNGILHAAWSDGRIGTERGIFYSQSSDGGMTWRSNARVDGFPGFNNYAPSIVVDNSGGTHTGNIYIAWQYNQASLADIYVIRSIDGGSTWRDKNRIDDAPADTVSTIPRIAVDTDGRIYVSFQDLREGNSNVYVVRSDDGGVSWFPPVRVSQSNNSDAYSSLAAYGGIIYVAWQETGFTSHDLWIAESNDRGNTWQIHNVFSVTVGSGDVYHISIAVDPSGIVHAVWLMVDATYESFIPYCQSIDRGATWSPLVQINDFPSSTTYTQASVTISYSAGTLFAVWTDNRNGDFDIFASWSEDNGNTWGDGIFNNNDLRVDDTDDNGVSSDDATDQRAPSSAAGPFGIYVIWADFRDSVSYHAYFASFEISEMLITEIQDSPDGFEQIEIFNHGGKIIDMVGWTIGIDSIYYDLSSLGLVAPGTHITIGDPATADITIDITLGDEGGTVQLRNSFGVVKDLISYGLKGPVPDPIISESVERVRVGSIYSSSWSRLSVPSFGVPNSGRLPINNPSLVLNEVLFNTANQDDRFIELYFKDRGLFNIMDYILVGDVSYHLPNVILSEANPFYVIRPIQFPSLFSEMNTSGDNLYLYNPSGAFLDMVGWSSSHAQDRSMVRIPDGFGNADGYDDVTSIMAGWVFDQIPSLPLVLIGPRQSKGGDLGTWVFYILTITNKEAMDAYVNIETLPGIQNWNMTLFQSDGVTLLSDSPGDPDNIPDVGLLPPEYSIDIQVAVDIPQTPQIQDWEFSLVKATISFNPIASASVLLTTNIYPYESPTSSANPTTIWIDNSPPTYQPKETTLRLNVTGRGTALFRMRPQDTVLIIDSSGSMTMNDPGNLRLEATKHYVDLLTIPDRGAVVDFSDSAILVNGDHLSSDYAQIKSNIDTIGAVGGTNLLLPIRVATDELLSYGNRSHLWIEILLTDGDDTAGNTNTQILAEAQRAADNGIIIFTIGLIGTGGVDELLLQQIAILTGGIYLRATTANDLDAVYQQIGNIVKNLAGYDNDVTDDIPMINVFLPDYVNYIAGSANPPPDYLGQYLGMTNLQWNVSKLNINETWIATLRITASTDGYNLRALSYPESRVTYVRYDDLQISIPFPEILIDVLAPPPPPPKPVNYTITRMPLIGNVIVDGNNYSVPARFSWIPGEVHIIEAPLADVVAPGERWVFESWDDGGDVIHNFTVGDSDKTITAVYSHQYRPFIELIGISGAHSVSAYYTVKRLSKIQPNLYSTWSEWVDEGSTLFFDSYGSGSDSKQRWITLEDFNTPPWTSVDSAFNRVVLYWRQVAPNVILVGLPDTHPVPIRFTQFNNQNSKSSHSSWMDWVDYRTPLKVGGRIMIPPSERYVNLVQKEMETLEWHVDSAITYMIPFVHQYKPTVILIGTDSEHTVDVLYVDSSKNQANRVMSEVSGSWEEWADTATQVHFSNVTTGDIPHRALNETTLTVDSAFFAYIVYAPPPPINQEPNYKPLISALFVIILVILGLFWGNRKPWDRYLSPPKEGESPEDFAARERLLKKTSISEKISLLNLNELEIKFTRDRRWTMRMLVLPFAAVECLIGITSFFTGILSVPEGGNWLSIGLIVNTFLLLAGIAYDLSVQRYGYKVPKEEELAKLKSNDRAIKNEGSGSKQDKPVENLSEKS